MARFVKSWITEGAVDRITSGSSPVLIACIRRDHDIVNTLQDLDVIADYFSSEMDVYYALEDAFPFLSQTYGFSGTPTLLLIHQGRVLGTVLGKESVHELIKYVSIMLLDHERSVSAKLLDNKTSVKSEEGEGS